MSEHQPVCREGFWSTGEYSYLPMPVSSEYPWRGKSEFLEQLTVKELKAIRSFTRGFSTCRICHKANGSIEYLNLVDNWCWPEGFRHYVEAHNVRPSLAFQEYVLGKEIK